MRVHIDYFPYISFALTAPYLSLQQYRARSKVLNLLSSKSQYPVKQAPILFLILLGERMQARGEYSCKWSVFL